MQQDEILKEQKTYIMILLFPLKRQPHYLVFSQSPDSSVRDTVIGLCSLVLGKVTSGDRPSLGSPPCHLYIIILKVLSQNWI